MNVTSIFLLRCPYPRKTSDAYTNVCYSDANNTLKIGRGKTDLGGGQAVERGLLFIQQTQLPNIEIIEYIPRS